MPWFDQSKSKAESKTLAAPSAQDAARRAYALNVVVVVGKTFAASGFLPSQLPTLPAEHARSIEETAAKICQRMAGISHKIGLLNYFSPGEAYLLSTPFGQLDDQMIIDAIWRAEAMQTVLWSLGAIATLPGFDQQAADEIMKVLHLDRFEDFVTGAQLRNREELENARANAELWHWRSRTRTLIEENRPFPEMPQFKSYDGIVRFTAKTANAKGDLTEIIAEDFSAKGKAYRDLTKTEWAEVQSITSERHFALNWLCGLAPNNDWDETPTAT